MWKVQLFIFVIVCYGIQKSSSSHRFRTMGLDRAYVMTGRSLYLAIYGSKFEFDSKTTCKFRGLLQQIFKGFAQNNTKEHLLKITKTKTTHKSDEIDGLLNEYININIDIQEDVNLRQFFLFWGIKSHIRNLRFQNITKEIYY